MRFGAQKSRKIAWKCVRVDLAIIDSAEGAVRACGEKHHFVIEKQTHENMKSCLIPGNVRAGSVRM